MSDQELSFVEPLHFLKGEKIRSKMMETRSKNRLKRKNKSKAVKLNKKRSKNK